RIERDTARTLRLMHEGADVIYQATLFDGTWIGYVDFLIRLDGESALGAHHYEVVDTKLARRTKGGALLQMCVYSELVAGIQVRRLEGANIGTLTELATLPEPPPAVDGISAAALTGLRDQASLQDRSRDLEAPLYEYLPPQANLGLCALPEPSPGDLFFDIEGDPFAEDDGLEYLFGVWDPAHRDTHGEPEFRTWWAHSRPKERVAFEAFVDFVMDRWRREPAMHVYHYAAYERARMGMLSTRHATREQEVDSMLRGGLFVDLYKVVRQGLRIGTPSYSIKKLEPL